MPIQQWEDNIILVDLGDEPALSDDLSALADRYEDISQLLRLRELSMNSDTDLILCAMNESIWGVLIVAGLDKIFRCTPDLLTALATVQLDEEP
jgi:hypothetical protein